jgi:hypothetical protein
LTGFSNTPLSVGNHIARKSALQRLLIREMRSLICPCNSLFRFTPGEALVPPNQQFREKQCDFGGQNSANSLLFSLLAGNSGGEGLAPDCALRQQVLTAEKFRRSSPRNLQNMPVLRNIRPQTGLRRTDCPAAKWSLSRLFSGGHMRSPVSSRALTSGLPVTQAQAVS